MAHYPTRDAEELDRFWAAIKAARTAEDAEHAEPTVDLASLTTDARRRLWRYLKANHPVYADLLQSPLVQKTRALFDARVHLRISVVEAALHGHD